MVFRRLYSELFEINNPECLQVRCSKLTRREPQFEFVSWWCTSLHSKRDKANDTAKRRVKLQVNHGVGIMSSRLSVWLEVQTMVTYVNISHVKWAYLTPKNHLGLFSPQFGALFLGAYFLNSILSNPRKSGFASEFCTPELHQAGIPAFLKMEQCELLVGGWIHQAIWKIMLSRQNGFKSSPIFGVNKQKSLRNATNQTLPECRRKNGRNSTPQYHLWKSLLEDEFLSKFSMKTYQKPYVNDMNHESSWLVHSYRDPFKILAYWKKSPYNLGSISSPTNPNHGFWNLAFTFDRCLARGASRWGPTPTPSEK